ncbi:hypothetical protein KBB08_03115 [Candidatus Gracilibacteria bacterium]|nr:hypothetical protein [Candidatus Gracilibacteria bacterium]
MTIQATFESELHHHNLTIAQRYPVSGGGEVALSADKTIALVWTDGRYPALEKGYSLNQVCTESITVLFGAVIAEVNGAIQVAHQGESIRITPGQAYSMSGKAVCKVVISPPWDSAQNSFVSTDSHPQQ